MNVYMVRDSETCDDYIVEATSFQGAVDRLAAKLVEDNKDESEPLTQAEAVDCIQSVNLISKEPILR